MRYLFDKIGKVFGLIVDAEVIIPAILAALLLLIGPPIACFYFLRAHHYVPALVSGGLWSLAVVAAIRDLRRRHFGLVSATLSVLWAVVTMIIWWRLDAL